MTKATTREQVQGPAGTLFVDDGGADNERIPVVLVHSFAGSSAQWAPQLARLRTTRRAIALDLRGHGESAAPNDGDYAIESLAADIGAVMGPRADECRADRPRPGRQGRPGVRRRPS